MQTFTEQFYVNKKMFALVSQFLFPDFLFLKEGLLHILINCMISLPPFLDVNRMSMSTASFLAQLDSGILCL